MDDMNDLVVHIPAGEVALDGVLTVPEGAGAVVVFAHGAGSDRKSHRNLYTAGHLNEAGVGTLLFDLLTPEEKEAYRQNVFDIGRLTERLVAVTRWLMSQPETKGKKIGFLGASTGAAAALNAAARLGNRISAAVSRGGRPDLAEQDHLKEISAPTMFIIGANDTEVIEASKPPYAKLVCQKDWKLVPGATHVFEEAGTLEIAAQLALDFLKKHLT